MKLLKLITAATVMLATVSMSAQERDIAIGVKGGVNFATVTGNDANSPDSRTSFHVGLLTEFPMNDMFSIQAEALYSGQGFKGNFSGTDGDKVEYQLDYISIPVLAKLYITRGLSVEVGPQFSFKINDEFDFNPNSDGGDINLDNTSYAAKDFEVAVGAGLTFQTEMGFFASGRYNYGLTEIIENTDLKNSVFQVGVGYKF
ncbi:MAG: porin family protein [Flavobacterium sp.]